MSREQLKKVITPLAELEKSQIREIAQKLNLVTANKKDSTGICFIGERNFGQFLQIIFLLRRWYYWHNHK
ncbi:hypothetical protein NW067_03325 [Mycoplasmopsis cynos]|nr:hypothetical protein [Mycoplasmopsis cynos]UWV83332.1 hypothetical protein NW067_03325 [Mycoplasmopsis cynos]